MTDGIKYIKNKYFVLLSFDGKFKFVSGVLNIIATLPAEIRPKMRAVCMVKINEINTTETTAIEVRTDGTIITNGLYKYQNEEHYLLGTVIYFI